MEWRKSRNLPRVFRPRMPPPSVAISDLTPLLSAEIRGARYTCFDPANDGRSQTPHVKTLLYLFPGWVPMGMKCVNEKGLAITHVNVPRTKTPYDPDKPQFTHNFLEKIVAECSTVKQAVAMVRAHSLPPGEHGAHVHVMLVDRSGNSAILEWIDGEVKVTPRSGPTQIMTNTLIGKPSPTEGPNSRLNRGRRMLAEVKEASVASAISVLKEISIHARHKGDEVGSVESAVFDLTGGKVHLYFKRDFDHPLTLDLNQEIEEGPRTVDLRKLFPNPVPFETGDRYENGPVPANSASAK
jgi:hypothetical protein